MHAMQRPEGIGTSEADDLIALRRLTPFSALSAGRFTTLCRDAWSRTLPARVPLLTEGTRADVLHVVLEGCVELYARANGREATMGVVRAGGSFLLSAVVRDLPCLTSARTCAPSRLLLLPATDVRAAMEEDPAFARALVHELADAERAEVRAHKEIKLRSAVQRLAARLLRYEHEQGASGSLVLPCDKRTLASLLAMTPENLSRAFATLGRSGVVVRGRTIALTDRKALAELARPDPLIDGRRSRRRRARSA